MQKAQNVVSPYSPPTSTPHTRLCSHDAPSFVCALMISWNTPNVFYGCYNVLSHKKIYDFQIPKLHRWACSANAINLCISHICHIYIDCICVLSLYTCIGLRGYPEFGIDVCVIHIHTQTEYAISCWLASYFSLSRPLARLLSHLDCMLHCKKMKRSSDCRTKSTLLCMGFGYIDGDRNAHFIQTYEHLTKLCAIALFFLNNSTLLTQNASEKRKMLKDKQEK